MPISIGELARRFSWPTKAKELLEIDIQTNISRRNEAWARKNLAIWCQRVVDKKLVPQVLIEWKENGQISKKTGIVLEVGVLADSQAEDLNDGYKRKQVVVLQRFGGLIKLAKVYNMNDESAIRFELEGDPEELKGENYMHLATYAYKAIGLALEGKHRPTPKIALPLETTV